ncbi:MAG: hypothetical protein IPJ38_15525 [Dechloromonas sp.]|uniref:Uncharacterized protein n=1 Tax=Candidatus Dechloromonas phosphorivorans TaxID=2899244 RepID=A0A935KBD9_9RHOO|nr:hypothetical protein [Candidatus Dechloromonas phosphorivorans]
MAHIGQEGALARLAASAAFFASANSAVRELTSVSRWWRCCSSSASVCLREVISVEMPQRVKRSLQHHVAAT